MKQITTIQAAEEYLSQYIPVTKELTGKDVTVQRMWPLLQAVGNPQEKLQVIHIAGTSGKTSTASYVSALLTQAGMNVGLTVSPHVRSITERLQINGQPMGSERFCELLTEFKNLITDLEVQPAYFEVLIAFILWSFVEEAVDYAVIETGLGGLHDATNVFRSQQKVCVITDIGFDHMHVLGDTLTQIAAQKAGIIQDSNHVFMYQQNAEVMTQVEDAAADKRAVLHIVDPVSFQGGLPQYQQRNWQLAKAVFDYIQQRDGLDVVSHQGLEDTKQNVLGRMQLVQNGGTVFVIDGAHNAQKMQAFVSSYSARFGNDPVPVLLTMKKGKEYIEVIDLLAPFAERFVLASFSARQDTPIQSIDPEVLANYIAEKYPAISFTIVDTVSDALDELQTGAPKRAIVTGSFYAIGEVLSHLEN